MLEQNGSLTILYPNPLGPQPIWLAPGTYRIVEIHQGRWDIDFAVIERTTAIPWYGLGNADRIVIDQGGVTISISAPA